MNLVKKHLAQAVVNREPALTYFTIHGRFRLIDAFRPHGPVFQRESKDVASCDVGYAKV